MAARAIKKVLPDAVVSGRIAIWVFGDPIATHVGESKGRHIHQPGKCHMEGETNRPLLHRDN